MPIARRDWIHGITSAKKIQIFAMLGFAVLYSTLVLYATGYDRGRFLSILTGCLLFSWLEPNHPRLGFRILLQHFVTHFAAPAGLFVTAKRQSGIKYVVTIDPDRAGSQFGRNPVRFGDVTGPDACRKAVFGLVRARN